MGKVLQTSGVREHISKLITCDFFIPKHEILEKANRKHEVMVDRIKNIFERMGKYCEKEYKVIYGNLKGIIDLVCSDDERDFIIEVKSTHASRARLQDLLQLSIYAYLYTAQKQDNEKEVELALMYKYGDKTKEKIFVLKIEDDDLKNKLIDLGERLAGTRTRHSDKELFVISDLCNICDNNKCPFKPISG